MSGTPKSNGFDLDAMTITSVERSHVGEGRLSIVEAAACWAGEEPNLEPSAASPVLTTFVGMWSEGLRGSAKARRQDLKRLVPRLACSAAPELESVRAWMVGDWLVRTCIPALLAATDLPELRELIGQLEELAPLASDDDGPPAVDLLREVEAVVGAHHRRLQPDAYLPSDLRWGSAADRLGVLAAWNVLVMGKGDAGTLRSLGRHGRAIVELSMGLIALRSARAEFESRSGTRPVLPPGSSLPGPSWLNRVVSERGRIGLHVYETGMRAIDDATSAVALSIDDLVDRLLTLTDRTT